MRKPPFNRLELHGQKYGRLTVLNEGDKRNGQRYWNCICECGNTTIVSQLNIRNGKTTSCGCFHKEIVSATFTIHGLSQTPEYEVWSSMRQRCNNSKNKSFANYGGRGIKICDRWNDFQNFLADIGKRPGENYSIERIDNSKGYQPDNCHWATTGEQSFNRRNNHFIKFNGQNLSLSQWAEKIGMSPSLLHSRLNKLKWSVEKALTTPKSDK